MKRPSMGAMAGLLAAWTWGCATDGPGLTVGELELTGPPGSGEPNLYATLDGRAVLTWFEPAGEGHALKVAERDADGWSERRTVVEGRDFFVNWADFPSIVEMSDGTWAVHWLEKVAEDPYAYHVMMSLSRDRGLSWSEPFVPHDDRSPTEHGFVSMAPFGDGAALIWLDGREMTGGEAAERAGLERGEMTLRTTTLSSNGARGDDVLLDGRTCECCQTALTRTRAGLVAAYRDRSPEEIRDIAVTRFAHGGWSEPQHVAEDGWYYPGCPVNGPQLASRGDSVAVAWFTAPDNQPAVYAAYSFDGGASFGDRIRVDEGDPLGRVDLELLPGGQAVVVWLERTAEAAAVRSRLVSPDGTMGDGVLISETSESRSSGFPRMARTGEHLLVAWTLTGEEGGIRVARLELEGR